MDALIVDIMGLTFKVKADRIVHRIERESGMDRLSEKLAKAGGVVARITAKIEEEADAVIARESVLSAKTTYAFLGHHTMLDDAQKGLDALERQLALVANDPLPSSGDLVKDIKGEAGATPIIVNPSPLPNAGHPVMKNIHTNNGQ